MGRPELPFDYQRALKTVKSYPIIHKYFPVDRFIVRPAAALVVGIFFRTRVKPNHLTGVSFLLSVVSGIVFAFGEPAFVVAGGCLAMLSDIFDNADGMLARAKNMTSRFGAFLDLFLDRIGDFAVLTGITFGIYRVTADPRVLMLGLLTIGLYLLQVGLYYLNNIYTGASSIGEGAEAKNLAVFAILVLSLVGRPIWILIGILMLGILGTVSKVIRFMIKGRVPPASPAR